MAQQRYRKRRGVRLDVHIAPELHGLLLQAVDASHKTITDFVQDAIAVKLKGWEAPADYIVSRREKAGKAVAPVFDPVHYHESGWPWKYTENYKAEIGFALQDGPEELRNRMQQARQMWNIEEEYTEAQLQETLRWYRAQKKGGKK